MPAAVPFDTLDYARKLQTAGVPVEQAELQATALSEALAGSVASRNDLAGLESRLDGKFANFENRIDVKFANLESNLDERFANVDIRFAGLESRIELKFANLEVKVGGKIETLKWMFGVLVALNGAVFIQLLLKH